MYIIKYFYSLIFRYKFLLVLIIFLEVSFLIRIHQWSLVAFHDENSRDYLVANHIYKYHEFPLAGPGDEGRYFLRNSPFYFYFLASFLFMQDSLNFLEMVNIFLQLANIVIIYLLAKRLFGVYPALISSAIFAFGDYFVSQSNILWQPYIMQPFVNLSYLLLAIGYQKRNYPLLIIAVIIFLLAATLHRSAIAQLPLIILVILLILKSWKAKLMIYVSTVITVIVVQLLLYLPVLFSKLRTALDVPYFNRNLEKLSPFLPEVLLVLVSYFILSKSPHKRISFIIMAAIFLQLCVAAFFGLTDIRYFTPILALFVILVSAAIACSSYIRKLPNIIRVALAILIIYSVSPNLYSKFTNSLEGSKKADFPPTATVVKKVVEIKKSENFPDYKFFRITTYRNGNKYGRLEGAFYVPLEKMLNQKFVAVDENALLFNNTSYVINNYYETNNDNYYFLVCYEYKNLAMINEYCLNSFLQDNKNFDIIDLIYQGIVHENMSIYLLKKNA